MSIPVRRVSRSLLLEWLAASLLLLPPFLSGRLLLIDDALITARYSRNWIEGWGFVYNVGEAVLGTTAPLWGLLIAPIFALPLTPANQARVLGGLGLVLTSLAVTLLARGLVRRPSRARYWLIAGLCLIPATRLAATMGMETAALCAVTIALWRLLSDPEPIAHRERWAALLAAIALGLRLDAIFLLAAFAAAYCIVCRPGWSNLMAFARPVGAAAVVVSAWLAFCYLRYGHVVPHSMLAKASDLSQVGPLKLAALGTNSLELLLLPYPWPRVVVRGLAWLWPTVALVALGLGLRSHLRSEGASTRLLAWATLLYVPAYALFLTVGGAGIFPWYGHVASLLCWANTFGTWSLAPRPRWGSWAATVSVPFLALLFALDLRGLYRRGSESSWALGQALQRRGCSSIMLEPIGHIGFVSRCKRVIDLAALVSPRVAELRDLSRPGWFAEATERFEPEQIVLRRGEVERNLGWNVGTLFANDAQRKSWLKRYQRVETQEAWSESYDLYERRR